MKVIGRWKDLGSIILSEVTQTWKQTTVVLILGV